MSTSYTGITGKIYELAEEKIAGGGEGTIYAILENDCQVAKVFKEKYRTSIRENKLKLMVGYHLSVEQLSEITWPQDVLYGKEGFVGYVMPKLKNAKNLNLVYSKSMEEIGLKERVTIAYNICAAVGEIHKIGQVCGDLNPQNICVNLDDTTKNKYHVTLVDTDSYHISKDGETYRCSVGLPEYLAPEIQKKLGNGINLESLPLPTFTKETDLFALAVHIFSLLMGGCHPFACAKDTGNGYKNTMEVMEGLEQDSVVLPQPIENIREGFFPFHQKKDGITYPLYAPKFEFLPEELRLLFIRTFVDGFYNPSLRGTSEEWKTALKNAITRFDVLECDKKHYYFNLSQECPYCQAQERMREMMKVHIPLVDIPQPSKDSSNLSSNKTQPSGGQTSTQNTGIGLIAGSFIIAVIMLLLCLIIGLYIKDNNGSSSYDDYSYEDGIEEERITTIEEYYSEVLEKAKNCVANSDYVNGENFFKEAISINNTKEEAYMELAKMYVIQGKLSEAKDTLENGIENADDDKQLIDYQYDTVEVKLGRLEIGEKLYDQISNGKYLSAVEEMYEYYDEDNVKIYIEDGRLVDKINDGYGLLFDIDNTYTYLGQIKNGKAEGEGVEVGSEGEGYYTVEGKFKKGYVNGKCVYFSSVNEFSDGEKYKSTIIGNYTNGYEDGEMQEKIEYISSGEHDDIYYWHSDMGERKVLRYEDGEYVYAESEDGEWYLCNSDKSNLSECGVPRMK